MVGLAVLGAGAVCAGLAAATGRSPALVAGKPNSAALGCALAPLQIDPSRVAVVGDSVEADVALARAVGARSISLPSRARLIACPNRRTPRG